MTTSIDAQQYIVRSGFESPRSAGTTARSLRAIDQDVSREKWDRCYAFFRKAKHLNANWDGDGAAPPRADVIDSLIFYFQYYLEKTANFPGPTRFAITPDGTVFVEWQEPGIYMDLECSEPGQAEFLTIESDTPSTHDLIRWSIPMVATAPTAIVAIPFGFEEGSRSAAFSIGPIELRPAAQLRAPKLAVIEEADPVGSEELVLRRIPNLVPGFVNFDLPMPVMRLAFQPSRSDADGLSVFREIFTTARDVAASGNNPRGYYVASLAVEAILGLGLTVIPNPLGDGPRGHALIPEIHTDSSRKTKNLQIELAK